MNQLAIAIKRIPLCRLCGQPLSAQDVKLKVSSHFACIVEDVLTHPANK